MSDEFMKQRAAARKAASTAGPDNLLADTLTTLKEHGKGPEDVQWVGAVVFGWCSWSDFAKHADIQYDGGFGLEEIACDLVVVGDGWWLERWDYDGSEGWSFKTAPQKPGNHRVPELYSRGQQASFYGCEMSLSGLNRATPAEPTGEGEP